MSGKVTEVVFGAISAPAFLSFMNIGVFGDSIFNQTVDLGIISTTFAGLIIVGGILIASAISTRDNFFATWLRGQLRTSEQIIGVLSFVFVLAVLVPQVQGAIIGLPTFLKLLIASIGVISMMTVLHNEIPNF